MTTRRTFTRFGVKGAVVAAVAAMAVVGCGFMMKPSESNMVAMTTQLRGANEVPPNSSTATGSVDAAFNKDTMQLKWKVNYSGLTGPATMVSLLQKRQSQFGQII